jgi:hypothetical protein
MGYRDDFFVRGNIVGITGPVHELPSVYFKNADGEYGHITQVHGHSFNWGRTTVRTDPGWVITNVCPRQCGCGRVTSHEINGAGRVFHKSRSVFKAVATLSPGDLDVVAEAIHRCPYEKTDPHTGAARRAEEERFDQLWVDQHQPLPGGRRGAVDFTANGLANKVLGIAYPGRV